MPLSNPNRFVSDANKLGTTLVCLIVIGLGTTVFVWVLKEVLRDHAMQQWPKAACTVLHTQVAPKADGYAFEVSYRYETNGTAHISKTYRSGYRVSNHYADAEKLARQYTVDSEHQCFVNPSNPDDAVLEVQPLASLVAFMLIPLAFVFAGGGLLYLVWFRKARPSNTVDPAPGGPISDRGVKLKGVPVGMMSFGVFFVVGVVITVFFSIPTERKMLASRNWRATPCTIIASRLRSEEGNHGTPLYSIDIEYTYKVNGQSYTTDRYSVVSDSSGVADEKARVVKQYRQNPAATCYVNPSDPSEAVLKPGWRAEGLLPLIPLVFVLVGAGGMYGMYRVARKPAA
jgi:hypothetical protein